MPTAVDICNMALAQLGKPEIASMDENSAAAGWVRRAYDGARRDVLSRSDWVFARATVGLQGVTDTSETQFTYLYSRPADLVKVRAVGDGSEPYQRAVPWRGQPYELGGRYIRGLSPLAVLAYTRDVTDPNEWSPGFAEAVALKLGSMIAMQATGRSDVAINLQKLYENQLLIAIESDAAQERRVWTDDEATQIEHLPHEALPDFPYDQTMLWGPTGVGTPVSSGGGAPPSEIVTIYEEGAGVDTDYVSIYDPSSTSGTGTDYVAIYRGAKQ